MRLSSPARAIVWSMLKSNQLSVIMLALSIPLLLLLRIVLNEFLPQEIYQNMIDKSSLLLIMISSLLVMLFTFNGFNSHFTKTTFPKYTFTHPISSFQLAIIPVGLGIVISYIYYLIWFSFIIEYPFNFSQYFILFSLICSSVSWLQVMSWRYNDAPYVNVVLMISLGALLFILFVSSWDATSFTAIINLNLTYILLLLLPLSGILLAINSVANCRTNQNQRKARFLSNVRFIGFNLPTNYISITQALFRYEWRVFGWILPMAGIPMILLLLWIGFDSIPLGKTMDIMALMIFILIYIPWFLPAEMAKSELSVGSRSKTRSNLSSFICNLPISNFQMAMAKLKMYAFSTIIFHLMLLVVINYFVFSIEPSYSVNSFGNNEVTPSIVNPWQWLNQNFSLLQSLSIVLCLNLIIPIITWTLGGNTLAWCLKGERFFNARRMVILALGLIVVIPLIVNVFTTESFRLTIWRYAPFFNWTLFITILVVFIRSFKGYLNVEKLQCIKRRLMTITVVFLFIGITFLSIDITRISKFHFLLILLDFALLSILPFLTSPLYVAKNRAR